MKQCVLRGEARCTDVQNHEQMLGLEHVPFLGDLESWNLFLFWGAGHARYDIH